MSTGLRRTASASMGFAELEADTTTTGISVEHDQSRQRRLAEQVQRFRSVPGTGHRVALRLQQIAQGFERVRIIFNYEDGRSCARGVTYHVRIAFNKVHQAWGCERVSDRSVKDRALAGFNSTDSSQDSC